LFSAKLNKVVTKPAKHCATPHDVGKIFHDQINHLYTLSLLLTADHSKAEQCFVAGLEDCLEGKPAFREWAHSWARRNVIMNAIRIVSPMQDEIPAAARDREPPAPVLEACTPAAAITKLQPFERFVYVLSLLEGYSDPECSILLDCTISKITRARSQALQKVAGVLLRWDPSTGGR
jgi:DNA-directed RNA polymerase specialized sigma24 family protein